MNAEVIPFPASRRLAFIARQARYAASIGPDAAERYLERQLRHQRAVMLCHGIGADVVDSELHAMNSAIRAALWKAVLQPTGGPR